MIRINLLPVRQVRKVQERRRHAFVAVGALLVEALVLFVVHDDKAGGIEERGRMVKDLQTQIEQLKQDVGDFDKLSQQRDRLVAQRKVINSLQTGRSGPVMTMREISDILSEGKGPTVDQAAYEALLRREPNAAFNPRWNPRRLWLERIDEVGKSLTILGKAKDHDDVAELLKRLSLSKYFRDVQLKRDDQVQDEKFGLKVVKFSLTCSSVN